MKEIEQDANVEMLWQQEKDSRKEGRFKKLVRENKKKGGEKNEGGGKQPFKKV